MKKKLSILLLAGACLTLSVGCQKTASSDSTDSSNNGTSEKASSDNGNDQISAGGKDSSSKADDKTSSSSSGIPTYIPDLDEFLAHFTNHNVSITNKYYTLDFYGDNAMGWTSTGKNSNYPSTSNFKQVAVGDDGVWTWDTDEDGKFKLDQIVSPIKIYDDMTVLYSDYYDALDSFGASEDEWVASTTKTNVYTIADDCDTDIMSAIPALASYFAGEEHAILGSITSIETSNVQMTIKDQFTATVSFKAYVKAKSNGTLTSSFTITKAGENTVDGLDEFVEDPSEYLAATDFDDTVKDAMTEILGSTLDFNIGWTRGWMYSVGTDNFTNKQTTITYYDLLSGDITSAFATNLASKGFTAGEEEESDYGFTVYNYSKTVAEATDTSGDKISSISYNYADKSLFSSPALYPNGMMMVTITYGYADIDGLDKINTFLAKKPLKKDGTAALPQLELSTYNLANDKAYLMDYTMYYNANAGTSYEGFYLINIEFDSKEDSIAAMTTYIESMKTVKFKIDGTDTLSESGTEAYKLTNGAFKNKLNVSFTLYNKAENSTTDPDGGVQIALYY